jgi:hypothetical protein
VACQEKEPENRAFFLEKGKEIAQKTQTILLQNVAQALQKSGTAGAVAFCNLAALPLTDSLAQNLQASDYQFEIRRISLKNRQVRNRVSDPETISLLHFWEKAVQEKKSLSDTIFILDNEKVRYLKPILIGMETCLKCHGKKEEIDSATWQVLQNRYPEDKAFGYQMGDLRGAWEITFSARKK